ncbi:hypothetical protein L3i23_22500 [Herbiconiux sp. L3-i23]|nr:hypothetical protein L3i23_22500 [Herbiconiux sp. L3-i23]
MHQATAIRTPDRRLRVFVSSTLKELAAERRSARSALERLGAAPVMFELGARPHPPRDLYRAYLEQSDVFVGIYWQKYGWVAPGEEVSGLEDEYNLVPAEMPRLIYVKETTEREPRLVALLDRVRSDDRASFKYFSGDDELAQLLSADLAVLLAERFDESRLRQVSADDAPLVSAPELPAPLTETIGREREIAAVADLLTGPARLVTLTGPGGVGKTRVALEVARTLRSEFPGGVAFVPLGAVTDPGLVDSVVAGALGVRNTGDLPLRDKLVLALSGRRMLLVLDNLEQLLGAAASISELLQVLPGLRVLVTSRTLLRVAGERNVEIHPLALDRPDGAAMSPAVALFIDRARAVKPDFEPGVAEMGEIDAVVRALDGLPLAIELAAAQARLLTPRELRSRLASPLGVEGGGRRDLPERQRTLRGTVAWSVALLEPAERQALETLGVFAGPFSLAAAEAVVDAGLAVLAQLGALVDASLLRQVDDGDRTHFVLLSTVREFGLERLGEDGTVDAVRARHAAYYLAHAVAMETRLEGVTQRDAVDELAAEHGNLRAAVLFLLDTGDADRAATLAWALYSYWWLAGHLGEVRDWAERMLAAEAISPLTRAIALYFSCAISFWQRPADWIEAGLTESAELFHREGAPADEALALVSLALAKLAVTPPDPLAAEQILRTGISLFHSSGDEWGEAMALVTLGRVQIARGEIAEANRAFEEAEQCAEAGGDDLGIAIAVNHRSWVLLTTGRIDEARVAMEQALALSVRSHHMEGVAYGLEAFVGLAAATGDIDRAGRLLGAAQLLREQIGSFNPAEFMFHTVLIDRIRENGGGDALDAASSAGRRMTADDAVDLALGRGSPPPSEPAATEAQRA